MSLGKYANGVVEIKIQAIAPERIINLFWKTKLRLENY